MDYPAGFYVYVLSDPRTGLPFYVGKGQRSRAWQHERSVRAGDLSGNARKVAKIVEIFARGEEVSVQIVACYDSECDALDHEFRLVDATPTLTNVMPGGSGGSLCAKEVARRAAIRAQLRRRAIERDRKEAERRERTSQRERLLANARTDHERKQVEAWLDSMDEAQAARLLTPRSLAAKANDAIWEAKRAKKPNRRSGHRRKLFQRGEMQDMLSTDQVIP